MKGLGPWLTLQPKFAKKKRKGKQKEQRAQTDCLINLVLTSRSQGLTSKRRSLTGSQALRRALTRKVHFLEVQIILIMIAHNIIVADKTLGPEKEKQALLRNHNILQKVDTYGQENISPVKLIFFNMLHVPVLGHSVSITPNYICLPKYCLRKWCLLIDKS